MNKRFFILILMTALFTTIILSCDKEENEYSSPTPFSGGILGTIEGECANWDFVLMSFGDGNIIESAPIIDGKFNFASIPTPKAEELVLFIDSEAPVEMTDFQISDKNVKVCGLSLLAIKGKLDASYEGRSIVQGVYSYTYPNTYSVNIVMY